MNHRVCRFEFEGQVLHRLHRLGETSDDATLAKLREDEQNIRNEIAAEFKKSIATIAGGHDPLTVEVEIIFQEGSILFAGVVTILDGMGRLVGAAEFIAGAAAIVQWAVRKALAKRTPGAIVSPITVTNPIQPRPASTLGTVLANGSLPSNILLALTVLNAAIFIGGSVYTGLTVQNLQAQYRAAQEDISRAQAEYGAYRQRVQDVDTQIANLGSQSAAVSQKATALDSRIDAVQRNMTTLDSRIAAINSQADATMEKLRGQVGIQLVFQQANTLLRVLMVAMIAAAATGVAGLVFGLIAWRSS